MKLRLVLAWLVAAGLVAAGLAPMAAGAAGSPSIPLIRVGLTFPQSTLDPTKGTDSNWIDALSLDNLVRIGAKGQVEPGLATSVTVPNPTTYVYHLRQGVRFWDGSPLTATDVAYSLNYYRQPTSAVFGFGFENVSDVVATDPTTVTVTLKQPDASWKFTPALPYSGIFEARFAEAHKSTFGEPGTLLVGSGPFEIKSFDPTSGATLIANPDWWGGKVGVQRVEFKFYANDTSASLAFRAGDIDLDPFIDGPKSFAASSGAQILATPSCTNAYFSMNTQVAPWNNVHVRRAVAYALDRTGIIAAEGGYAEPVYTFIPPQSLETVGSPSQVKGLVSSLPLYRYDLARARQELKESPYPHGFSATIETFVYGTVVNTTEAIAGQLQKAGIDVKVKPLTLDQFEAAWDAAPASARPTSYFTTGCSSPDVSGYDWLLGSANTKPGGDNIADYAPPQMDTLLEQGLAATTPAERFPIYADISRNLAENVPYVPLFVHDDAIALSDRYSFSGFNQYSQDSPYVLGIRRRSQ